MGEIAITKRKISELPDGRTADLFTLENDNGVKVDITNYGGIIVRLWLPDRNGNFDDVVLGYDKLEQYFNDQNYFGAIIGRYANRIAEGEFELDDRKYQLEINEKFDSGGCTLHGGNSGFNSKLWTAEEIKIDGEKALKLTYLSKDGEGGFPGNLETAVYYSLTDDNKLRIEYEAETDKATIINLTQHSYFNLKGHGQGTIEDHLVYINSNKFTPVNNSMIPTGEVKDVENTPFDFSVIKEVSMDINENIEQLKITGGYDHNWILNKKGNSFELAARVIETKTGRQMEVWTTEPGIQFYTGNSISVCGKAKNDKKYPKRGALCLETQHFPNSPNQKEFPTTVLRPGETYKTKTEFHFTLI